MTSHIPYPPPPEFGWYDDDNTVMSDASAATDAPDTAQTDGSRRPVGDDAVPAGEAVQEASASRAVQATQDASAGQTPAESGPSAFDVAAAAPMDLGRNVAADTVTTTAQSVTTTDAVTTASSSDDDDEDWDSTVLSSSFTKEPEHRYELHNEATGQTVILEKSTLLGRKPSRNLPEGATSIKLADPTRTISRNHAAVSFDKDGNLWLEDYGSLNGTFLIVDGEESQVVKGTPVQVSVPCTVRIGDQFFSLDKAQ